MFRASLSHLRRCEYCKGQLIMKVLEKEDHVDFKKTAPTILCPRCDAPDPPRPRGENPS